MAAKARSLRQQPVLGRDLPAPQPANGSLEAEGEPQSRLPLKILAPNCPILKQGGKSTLSNALKATMSNPSAQATFFKKFNGRQN
jgi:hypothetical protein